MAKKTAESQRLVKVRDPGYGFLGALSRAEMHVVSGNDLKLFDFRRQKPGRSNIHAGVRSCEGQNGSQVELRIASARLISWTFDNPDAETDSVMGMCGWCFGDVAGDAGRYTLAHTSPSFFATDLMSEEEHLSSR